MDLPGLRHFANGRIFSDPVLAQVGEAEIHAVFTDQGWYTPDGLTKLESVTSWTDGKKANQSREESRQSYERVQSRNPSQRQTRKGQGSSRKKSQTSNRNRS